ncbi:MAG: hypothetical protein ACKVRN_06440 [Pyrinomonadaceae bacterium]
MPEFLHNTTASDLVISSSLKDAQWKNRQEPDAFERWHFDALSDDGREVLCITFYDNYAFSPRSFKRQKMVNGKSDAAQKRFPAVSLLYLIDGKIILRSVNEFRHDEFSISDSADFCCTIGESSFRVESASYGSGFIIKIDLATSAKRRIRAQLEWLSIEADLSKSDDESSTLASVWNLVAPRSDVSGRMTLIGRRGKLRRTVNFRGTGYHDHFRSSRSMADAVGSRFWGRAHFVDSTAVFHHHETKDSRCSKLFLIRDAKIKEHNVPGLQSFFTRNRFGLKLPERLYFLADDNIRLRVKPLRVIQAGFFETKIASEVTLMLGDGKPRKTVGITELVRPTRMRLGILRWLTNMRIGKNGKGPLF